MPYMVTFHSKSSRHAHFQSPGPCPAPQSSRALLPLSTLSPPPGQPERSRRLPGRGTSIHLSSLNASRPLGMPAGRNRFLDHLAINRRFGYDQHDSLVMRTLAIFLTPQHCFLYLPHQSPPGQPERSRRLPGRGTSIHLSSLNPLRPLGMPAGRNRF